ncbi:unnamed protein product [Brassica rapa subsp. narinosa]
MPLPWKKSKSGRISRLVSDLQQSPKHGGSLFVETGFPTSLIHLFVKNRDRLKKSSSKRNNKAQTQTAHTTRPRVLSPPLPQKLDPTLVTEDLTASKIDESLVNGSGSTSENRHDGDNNDGVGNGGNRGGGCCVLMVVVLALSTKKVAVGITISAFALLFLELAVARVFTLIYPCPDVKLIGKENGEEKRKNKKASFEISESFQDSKDCIEEIQFPAPEERKEKSKSSKLKSKIVPNKLRSYMKKKKEKQEAERVEVEIVQDDDESVTEVSSFYSEDRIESQISERDETGSNPPKLLESCEEEEESGSKGDLTKVIVLIVISLAGLFCGKVLAIALTLSWCLILRFVCCKSQTSFQHIKNKILLG